MNAPIPEGPIRLVLGNRCFVRRSDDDAAFWISDAPRLMADDTLREKQTSLSGEGFLSWITQRRLLMIDLQERRWQSVMAAFANATPLPLPESDRLHAVFALAGLLAAHPAAWPSQPKEPLRALLKRYDQPKNMLRYAPELMAQCAVLLREHRELPSSGANILYAWLSDLRKEECR